MSTDDLMPDAAAILHVIANNDRLTDNERWACSRGAMALAEVERLRAEVAQSEDTRTAGWKVAVLCGESQREAEAQRDRLLAAGNELAHRMPYQATEFARSGPVYERHPAATAWLALAAEVRAEMEDR